MTSFVQLIVAGLTVGSGYALTALGFHIILRATRIINFAQGEFVIVGGLFALTFVSVLHVSIWIALAGATVLGFALGLAYDAFILQPAARVSETAVTISTIGFSFVLLYGHALVPGWGSLPQPLPPFTGSDGEAFALGGVQIPEQSLWVLAMLGLIVLLLYVFFERTRYGKAIRAAANSPLGAELVGIDVGRARMVSVALACGIAAFGGTILGPITLVGGAGGVGIAIKGFCGAIIGGLESPVGAVLGGLIVGVVEKLIEGVFSYGVANPTVYALLLVFLLVRPQGILGTRGPVRD